MTTLRNKVVAVGELDVGWAKFPIKFKTTIKDGDDDLSGMVDFDKYEIHLETKQEPDIMRRTLLHECLHVVLSLAGVKSPDEDVHIPLTLTNEYITEQTTRGLFLFKKLNPELWTIIFDDE